MAPSASIQQPNLCDSVLCHLDDFSERVLISYREVGQDLSIQCDVGLFQPVDETAVRHPVLPGCGVDARDPQPSEITPALSSIAVGIPLGLHPGFVGPAEKMMSCSPVALRVSKDLLVATTLVSSTLYSHDYIAPSEN